ncbi:MAG: hypothetical protein ACXVKL_10755 [Candidatus Angelobacter sp.]
MPLKKSPMPNAAAPSPAAAPVVPVARADWTNETGFSSSLKTFSGGSLKKMVRAVTGIRAARIDQGPRQFDEILAGGVAIFQLGQQSLHGLQRFGFLVRIETALHGVELLAQGFHVHAVPGTGRVSGDEIAFGELLGRPEDAQYGELSSGEAR